MERTSRFGPYSPSNSATKIPCESASIAVSDTDESQRLTTFEIDTENEKIVYLRRIKRNQARYATEKNRACFAIETKIIRIHVGRFIRVLMVVSLGTAGSRYPRATMIPSW